MVTLSTEIILSTADASNIAAVYVAGVQRLGWDTPYSSASLDVFREDRRRGNRVSSCGSGSWLAVALSTELFATKARAAEM